MGRFTTDPELVGLASKTAEIFKSKKPFLTRKRHIVFLCGGSVKNSKSSARSKFLQYAKQHLDGVTFFLAEDASKDFAYHNSSPEFINLSEFETLLAGIADCIILFPETAGAIAELGLFSGCKSVAKNLLIVNDSRHQSEESFINLGPLDTIDRISRFKPRLVLDLSQPKPKFGDVKGRLERLGQFHNRRQFKRETFRDMTKSERLFVILEIINLFQVLSLSEISELVTIVFGKPNAKELRRLLSILIAAKYLKRKRQDEDFFGPVKPMQSFFDFEGFDYEAFRLEVVSYYERKDPHRFQLLQD